MTLDVAHPRRPGRADPAVLGEGPVWNPETERLIWVDILESEVHEYDPGGGEDTLVTRTPQHVGAALPRAGGGLVVNLRDGVGLYDPDGGFRWLAELPEEGVRGNDAAVAPDGALWAGTMRYDEAEGGGTLRRVSPGGEVVTVLDRVTISNGLGWSPDGRLLYHIDTPTRRVDVCAVDPASGLVTGRRPFVRVQGPGMPDGLTVDAAGCVWVALWKGGAVHRYRPDGGLDLSLDLPVTLTTACAFGGPGLRDLYITSATVGLSPAEREAQPLAGSLFVVPDAGQGLPSPPFAG